MKGIRSFFSKWQQDCYLWFFKKHSSRKFLPFFLVSGAELVNMGNQSFSILLIQIAKVHVTTGLLLQQLWGACGQLQGILIRQQHWLDFKKKGKSFPVLRQDSMPLSQLWWMSSSVQTEKRWVSPTNKL